MFVCLTNKNQQQENQYRSSSTALWRD